MSSDTSSGTSSDVPTPASADRSGTSQPSATDHDTSTPAEQAFDRAVDSSVRSADAAPTTSNPAEQALDHAIGTLDHGAVAAGGASDGPSGGLDSSDAPSYDAYARASARAELNDRIESGSTFSGDPVGRVDEWHFQGQNERGPSGQPDLGTCGIASVEGLARDQGIEVTEDDLVGAAHDQNLCTQDGTAGERGGTTVEERQALLDVAGVPSTVERPATSADLAKIVESDRGVIASVNAGSLWQSRLDEPGGREAWGQLDGGRLETNHAVVVTSIERNRDGELTGFVVNDSGNPDGPGTVVPAARWSQCWEQTAGDHPVNVTESPSPLRDRPGGR